MNHRNYSIINQPPSVDDLAILYLEAGFVKEADRLKLQRAIERTSRWWLAVDGSNGQSIGIARCLTDWARYACIYDVIVLHQHQRQGIGTAIMSLVLHDLIATDIDTIHLWPSIGKVPFYERLGFFALSAEQPVMKLNRDMAGKALHRAP